MYKKMAFLEMLKTLVIELRMHQNAFFNATISKIFQGGMPPDPPRFQMILGRAISSPGFRGQIVRIGLPKTFILW